MVSAPPVWAQAPAGPLTALLNGARAVAQGRVAAARQALEAVPESERSAEVDAALALTYLMVDDQAKARALLKRAVDVAPTLAESHYWTAVILLRQGNPRGALEALDVAVSLAPDQPRYHLARSLAMGVDGGQQGAVDELLSAARLEPNLLVPSYYPDEARGVLMLAESGLRAHPRKALVEEVLTLLYLESGLLLDARGRATSAKTPAALEVLGRLALSRNEPERAVRLLESAVSVRPKSARVRFHLARAAFAHGAEARALAALQEAARLEPGDHRIQTALGDIHLKQGDLERAELAYSYAISQKADPLALAGLGRTLELQGDLDGALRHYRRAVALAPAAIVPLERLARLLERRDPNDSQAKALRRRLEAATKLEQEITLRVEAARRAHQDHAAACAVIDSDPASAIQRLESSSKVGRAAKAFALAAAYSKSSKAGQARQQARAVLNALSPTVWARGLRPTIELRRKIGRNTVVRSIPMEYVIIND